MKRGILMNSINNIAERVIDKLLRTKDDPNCNDHFDIEVWEWPQGVAMYSLYLYYKQTGKEEYLNYMIEWYDRRLAGELPKKNVNTVAPLLALIHLYEIKPEEKYLKVCTEWANWIMNEMPRTEEGGLQHITTHLVNDGELWDDTLFMTVLFLSKFGKVTNNEACIKEGISQFLVHIKYLYDTATGLWYHGWNFNGRHNFGKVLWARGNSWFTSGVVEFIDIAEPEDVVKQYLIETLNAQVKALSNLQDKETGLWHTVLNDSTSYVETSASAGFAYGILKAVRKRYISESCKDIGLNAIIGILEKVKEDGTVTGVSYGTAVGENADHYKNIEQKTTAYGQGLTFLSLVEYCNHLSK
jgi:unsaturated rhamnogalacturonyl hydrolase